jgi:hypothetical protein
MVMGSFIPRLFAGPCLSVIFPALSSIFLTSPVMVALWARVAGNIKWLPARSQRR